MGELLKFQCTFLFSEKKKDLKDDYPSQESYFSVIIFGAFLVIYSKYIKCGNCSRWRVIYVPCASFNRKVSDPQTHQANRFRISSDLETVSAPFLIPGQRVLIGSPTASSHRPRPSYRCEPMETHTILLLSREHQSLSVGSWCWKFTRGQRVARWFPSVFYRI